MRIARTWFLADLTSKSGGLQTVLNRLCASLYSVGIFDQSTIQMRTSLVGVRRFDLAFDVGGCSAVRSVAFLLMEYDIAHSHVVLGSWWFRGVQRGGAPLALLGNFQRVEDMRAENSLIKLCLL